MLMLLLLLQRRRRRRAAAAVACVRSMHRFLWTRQECVVACVHGMCYAVCVAQSLVPEPKSALNSADRQRQTVHRPAACQSTQHIALLLTVQLHHPAHMVVLLLWSPHRGLALPCARLHGPCHGEIVCVTKSTWPVAPSRSCCALCVRNEDDGECLLVRCMR